MLWSYPGAFPREFSGWEGEVMSALGELRKVYVLDVLTGIVLAAAIIVAVPLLTSALS